MTRLLSSTQSTRSSKWLSATLVFQLLAIAVLAAGTAQGQSRFRATPLAPSDTIVMSPQEKQSAKSASLNGSKPNGSQPRNQPQEVTVACQTEVSIGPGTSPAGYLPLSLFGVPAIAGVTDDSVTNFNVPAFLYGGVSYTTVGISSNGYLIVGGQTDPADNTFVNQFFPNPTRPNNVLAPFWTDLNPQAGGALRIALLTDGTSTWIVADWEAVRYFSTTDTVNFQIWIGILGDPTPVEDISYPYGPIQGAGNGNALTVGAENAAGTRGDNEYFSFFGGGSVGTLPANGTELRVTTNTPTSCEAGAAEFAVGLTTANQLVSFSTAVPNAALTPIPITGLQPGEIVLAIDFRPLTGVLYGYTSYGRLVTLNTLTGAATLVGVPSRVLTGNEYGFDFNPTVDRIRIVNDLNQNSRINPNNGATVDSPVNDADLAFAAGDPFFGNDPTVTGAAHTNNVTGISPTTLYDIDAGFDILVTQGGINGSPSPNGGQLFTVGSLGVTTGPLVGFDVSGTTGFAYASLSDPFNRSSLYVINLANGNATLLGAIGNTVTSLRDLSISPTPPPTMIGLTNNNSLVTFNAGSPGVFLSNTPITGLIVGEAVIGIDYRPANNQLYGITAYNRLVTINTTTGAATVIGSLGGGLAGNEYGVDFNPVTDRLRVVNDNDQNASVDPTNAATTLETPLNPGNPNITGIAYSNNVSGALTTTLYDIDSNTDTLYTQTPPASGTLAAVGPLGVDTGALVGFDIAGNSGVAYASLSDPLSNVPSLYSINLASGAASLIGPIGPGTTIVRDITVSPIVSPTIFGVTASNKLVRFNANSPQGIAVTQQITGLLAGETILGIDFRPATGELFAYTGYNRLITIDTAIAVATAVGSPAGLAGTSYGFDFNPTVDLIRIVNDTDQNIRVNPNGTLAGTDTPLAFAAGDPNFGTNPNVVGSAYSNNFNGATTTTLYGIDSNIDHLVTQGSPNGAPTSPNTGQLFTVGSLGFNTSDIVGFDITSSNTAYAALQPALGGSSRLFTINLTTGAATLIGTIGGTEPLVGIAVAP